MDGRRRTKDEGRKTTGRSPLPPGEGPGQRAPLFGTRHAALDTRPAVLRPPSTVLWGNAALIAVYTLLVSLYGTRTPAWQVPDEPAHFNYARTIAATGTLPILQTGDYDGAYLEELKARHFPPELPVDRVRYESYQPPLYYALLAAFDRLAPGDTAVQSLRYLRLLSGLLGAVLLALAARATWVLFPGRAALTLAVPAFLATVPQHLAVLSGVTNDGLTEIVLTLALLLSFSALRRPSKAFRAPAQRDRLAWAMGLVLAAALLTKLNAYIVGLLFPLALLLPLLRPAERPEWRGRLARLLLVVATGAVLSTAWFGRGAFVYGPADPLGLNRHDQVVTGQPLTGPITGEVVDHFLLTAFHSFWAQFGWMGVPADERTYAFFGAYAAAGALGLAAYLVRLAFGRTRLGWPEGAGLTLCLVTVLAVAAIFIGYNVRFLQPQGRYLYPALFPLALFLALGYRQLLPWRWALAGLPVLLPALVAADLYALFRILVPNL